MIRGALDRDRILDLQYSPFGGQTLARRAVADALRESHHLPFSFDDVILTPGAMSALQLALRACGTPGDEVIVPVPCWVDHPLFAWAADRKPVTVLLHDESFALDVRAVEDAVTNQTCAVLLTDPANPTGRIYGAEELGELADTLHQAESRHGCEITLIADEVHRDFAAPGAFESASAFFDRTLLVYSFGKYHFMQGQRLGYIATSPRHPDRRAVSSELVRWVRISGTVGPTALMQRALPGLLGLEYDLGWLRRWRARLSRELSSQGYFVVDGDATLFVYVRTPAGYGDFDFTGELAADGVLVLPAPVFHHQGYFRVSLTGSEQMLERALPVLERFSRV